MRLLKAAVVFFSILLTACESSSKGSEAVYRIWLKTTSDIMTQNDYDCAGRRVKTLSYEQRGIPRDLPSNAREWYEMPPESDGEKGLIDVCTYLGKRFGTR